MSPPPPASRLPRLPRWSEVDPLVDAQKLQAALDVLEELRQAALAEPAREDELAEALVKQAQLRIGLHGDESALRFVRAQPWPRHLLHRTVLELFLGHVALAYLRRYSWEIRQRTLVASATEQDLGLLTADQVVGLALAAYQRAWASRAEFDATPATALAGFVLPGTYPERVRGSLRDAVSYLAADLLADTSHWRAEDTTELFRLDVTSLLASPLARPTAADVGAGAGELRLDDAGLHPLARLCAVLDDLERWHAAAGRGEAALAARIERCQKLFNALSEPEDKRAVEDALRDHLAAVAPQGFWAFGQATLADFVQRRGDLVAAHAAALAGQRAKRPDTVGAARCRAIVAALEAPDFVVGAMQTDGPGRRSLRVRHKNLAALHFRAYALDLEEFALRRQDYGLLPAHNEFRALHAESAGWFKKTKPVAEWRVDLAATPDYEFHHTHVTPPLAAAGLYVLMASTRGDFEDAEGNRLVAASLVISDLVVLVEPSHVGGVEVLVVQGANGAPVPDAEVLLCRYDYQARHVVTTSARTDAQGLYVFPSTALAGHGAHFVVARKDGHATLMPNVHRSMGDVNSSYSSHLIYTDRSVYRPEQKLHFKVLAFNADPETGKYRVSGGATIVVRLSDPRGNLVAQQRLTANAYGTAAGTFELPAGRLLGAWQLQTDAAAASVRVEEYKRPTFELEWLPDAQPLRLNEPCVVRGRATYLFGQPVARGRVRFRVERRPQLPRWWFWGDYAGASQPARVAAGEAAVRDDGTFEVRFVPAADARKAGVPGVTFGYTIRAELTDEGGETRTATKSARLGFASVEAALDLERAFALASAPLSVTVRRTDLDGRGRAGTGEWSLYAVAQPQGAVGGPADLPIGALPGEYSNAFRLPGDALNARWEAQGTSVEAQLEAWPDGARMGRGQCVHDAAGDAPLTLPPLPPGPYRLRYETRDEAGNKCEARTTFLSVGTSTPVAVPVVCMVESGTVRVGEVARIFAASGTFDQVLYLDLFHKGRRIERRVLKPGDPELIEYTMDEHLRGGFGVVLFAVRDYQLVVVARRVFVPWDDRALAIEFGTFRDRLRPGARERFRVTVRAPDGKPLGARAAEVLAYMYDRSLEAFAPHAPPSVVAQYPDQTRTRQPRASLQATTLVQFLNDHLTRYLNPPGYSPLQFQFHDRYGLGGPGAYGPPGLGMSVSPPLMMPMPDMAAMTAFAAPAPAGAAASMDYLSAEAPGAPPTGAPPGMPKGGGGEGGASGAGGEPEAPIELRSNFAETAFFLPQLLTESDGGVAIEFDTPDSVTAWALWVHAVTRDFRGASARREARTLKELMVRPYVPRFFREGDAAELRVVVHSAAERPLAGALTLEVIDPETERSLAHLFALESGAKSFELPPGGSATLTFPLAVTAPVGPVALRVAARAGDLSDGELRPLPVLPARVHLTQSRFAALRQRARRELRFADMARDDDRTLVHDALVVTLDAQLFFAALKALPYLVDYPYECTEQTVNRFVPAAILAGLYQRYPAVAAMARSLPERTTRLAAWTAEDPNRRMTLEETPWLRQSRGDDEPTRDLVNLLDPEAARATRATALDKLAKAQTSLGGFPWFPGGEPSPYFTLYILESLARAREFGAALPDALVGRAWSYLTRHFRADILPRLRAGAMPCEAITGLLYTLSSYSDASLGAGAFTLEERGEMLAYVWDRWRQHPPMLKCYLALVLHRAGRRDDAAAVLASVMDAARTDEDLGTYWAPEDRAWLWYNDTVETHAFALRALAEVSPDDPRAGGLVQWLLLNKKLNHWKSTRATALAVYVLAHQMDREGALGVRERARVSVGGEAREFVFEPERYTGKAQWVIPGGALAPASSSTVVVEKDSPGVMFASATWHFSTEELPPEARGDFFRVERRYFKRETHAAAVTLRPLGEPGVALAVGDEVEVHIAIHASAASECVHLRDPRPAGFEPASQTSGHRWELGVGFYEEVRDSGTNFFFERLPAGEYTLKHRLRAQMAGTFRAHPATVQSMYAPEFAAYSSGERVRIAPS